MSRCLGTGCTRVFYADDRGVSRVYRMSFSDGTWRMWRDTAEFSQRFDAEVSAGRAGISGSLQKSGDGGATWEHDFKVLQPPRHAVTTWCRAKPLLLVTSSEERNAEYTHINPERLPRSPAFSQAAVVEEPVKTIYVGGQNGVDADGKVVGPTVGEQASQALRNLATILESEGRAWRASCTGPSP